MRIVSDVPSGGMPLSVTVMVTGKRPGPCGGLGAQAKAPVAESIAAPWGAFASRRKVSICAGRSASVAAAVKVKVPPLVTDLLPIGDRTGRVLSEATAMLKMRAAFSAGAPPSVPLTVME
jgi:hypothetical protein